MIILFYSRIWHMFINITNTGIITDCQWHRDVTCLVLILIIGPENSISARKFIHCSQIAFYVSNKIISEAIKKMFFSKSKGRHEVIDIFGSISNFLVYKWQYFMNAFKLLTLLNFILFVKPKYYGFVILRGQRQSLGNEIEMED